MDYKKACKLLELEYNHNKNEIKKAYYRMAIRYHPDKNPDGEEMFKQISDAYIFLSDGNGIYIKREKTNYMDFIRKIINPECQWDELFISTTITNIFMNCEKRAIKVFEHLNKEKAIKLYQFICKYNDILYISEDILSQMKQILQKKMQTDNIIILNPRLDDLLNDNIYRLEIEDHVFYVPLWHNEVCYDISNNDLIVKCTPELMPNMTIDNYNNIYYKISVPIQKLLKDKELIIQMANKKWTIASSHLKIISEQTYILREQGMLKVDSNNLYNEKNRGHIYVEISLL